MKRLKNQHYLLPEIINELITFMRNDLLQLLFSSIHEATWYTLLADETTDIINQQ